MFFKKQKRPASRSDDDVYMESSICTGETLIGFRNKNTGKLENAVVVRSQSDIDDFYAEHGLINTKNYRKN